MTSKRPERPHLASRRRRMEARGRPTDREAHPIRGPPDACLSPKAASTRHRARGPAGRGRARLACASSRSPPDAVRYASQRAFSSICLRVLTARATQPQGHRVGTAICALPPEPLTRGLAASSSGRARSAGRRRPSTPRPGRAFGPSSPRQRFLRVLRPRPSIISPGTRRLSLTDRSFSLR